MNFDIKIDPITWQEYVSVQFRGKALLLDPFLNKSTCFTDRERRELALEGLVAPHVSTMEEQLHRVYSGFKRQASDLDQYIFLADLQDRNETLFFRLLYEHIEEMMPIVYTPTVGKACEQFSSLYRRGRGLYITYHMRDRIPEILRSWGCRRPSIIVVTDGERILGLGDLGAGGMGIPIGKLSLYTLCAGISPFSVLPITLDVGTNNEERLADPLYLGIRQRRVRGEDYQAFIDAFVEAVKEVFPSVLLQWEDFLKGNAIHQLARFRDELCTFNDDIQGTASVVVAGLYGALKLTGGAWRDQRVVFAGAGASAQGISHLIVAALMEDGLTEEQAARCIWTTDTRGLVTQARTGLEDFKAAYARPVAEVERWDVADPSAITLDEVVANVAPTILIGSSGTPGTFTESVVRGMARQVARPIIFPLSNPTSRSECTPEQAITWSDGTAIVATGSPFDPVTYKGKTYRIGQSNNAYIFPGLGLGVCVGRAKRVTDGMFLDAAKTLAEMVTPEDFEATSVFPPFSRIRDISHAIACAVIRRGVAEGHVDPEKLLNLEQSVRRAMWEPRYLPYKYEPQ